MAYKSRKARKAHRSYGGQVEKGHQYNAVGAPEDKEEHAKSDGFKRGGHVKRAHGGHVDGEKARHHMGKRARGGAMHEKKEHEAHRAHGGHMEHRKEHEEHRARGGHVGHRAHRTHGGAMKMGGSPLSSAHRVEGPGNAKGSPGEQAPLEGSG